MTPSSGQPVARGDDEDGASIPDRRTGVRPSTGAVATPPTRNAACRLRRRHR